MFQVYVTCSMYQYYSTALLYTANDRHYCLLLPLLLLLLLVNILYYYINNSLNIHIIIYGYLLCIIYIYILFTVVFDLYSVFTLHKRGLLKQHSAALPILYRIICGSPSRRYGLYADRLPVINDNNYYVLGIIILYEYGVRRRP